MRVLALCVCVCVCVCVYSADTVVGVGALALWWRLAAIVVSPHIAAQALHRPCTPPRITTHHGTFTPVLAMPWT
jgi:hypothetical protein